MSVAQSVVDGGRVRGSLSINGGQLALGEGKS